jgi:shikimate kinase
MTRHRRKLIYLLGFMGSGKSTVGPLLAKKLGWPFIDLDKVIEACGATHTIMWRQSSAQVTLPDNLDEHRRHLEAALQRLRGCHYQIVLRELETLNGRPERLRDWARLAIELAAQYA